mmetsp:Transcript_5505/g.12584  ORF Transcript_5505/g.12584 Transcript_5505/m.12584 type:complete len:252 (+) Transcript_5505:1711-2466(+)
MVYMLVPIPRRRAVSLAIVMWSPVIILTSTPMAMAASMVSLVSSRGGSNSGIKPWNSQLFTSSSRDRATPMARKPRCPNSSMIWSTLAAISVTLCERPAIIWGAPLHTRKVEPSGATIVASVRLITGSKGMNLVCLCLNRKSWLVTPSVRHLSIASCPSHLAARAALKITSSSLPKKVEGVSRVNLFLVKVPVLSLQRIVMPASSSMEARRDTIALLVARSRAPTAIVAVVTTCMAMGIEATSSTKQDTRA